MPTSPRLDKDSTDHASRARSRSSSVDSVDSLGRIKRRRVHGGDQAGSGSEEEDRRRRHQRRSRSRSRSAERHVKSTSAEPKDPAPAPAVQNEENDAGATLPLPPPSAAPDTRATTKILADAPPKEVALAPPPPRRRRRPDKPAASAQPAPPPATTTAVAAAAKSVLILGPAAHAFAPAPAPPAVPKKQRSPSPLKRSRPPRHPAGHGEDEEEDDDLDVVLETEKQKEEREMAERRARREKLLAQYGGSAAAGSGSSVSPSPSRLSPTVSTSSLVSLERQQDSKKEPTGKEKENTSKERQEQLRQFLNTTRKQREEELGGAGELPLLEDEDDGINVGAPEQIAAAEASGVLKHEAEGVGGNGEGETAELDIFSAEGATLAAALLKDGRGGGLGALGKGGLKEQRDAEGYFSHRVGEMLRGRYKILGTKGRGVFSSVLLAQDEQGAPSSNKVAIKVLRGNELMLQAGLKEAALLRDLTLGDPKDQGHVIRYVDQFKLGEHLCVVMEAMHMNLRKLLKTYGAAQGLSIKAVLSYTQQLLVGLTYLRKKGVVHADLKPDNLVVNEKLGVVKICDFGSAMRIQEMEELGEAPYLQSRFYRAPEVILGYGPPGPAMDMWSAAVSMYEMYTAKVMFPGRHNNEILKQMMDVRGPFAKKLLKKASPLLRKQHFDHDSGHFLSRELDRITQVESVRSVAPPAGPTKRLSEMLCPPRMAAKMPGDVKAGVALLETFLEQALVLDPTKRVEPLAALQLFKGGGGGSGK